MRPAPKKRISTNGEPTPLAAIGDALAGLSLPADLPPAPAAPIDAPSPAPNPGPNWKMGRVVLRRERAHRGGKTVIVVDDFATHLPRSVIEDVGRRLRAACGCGGTVRDRRIEIQGDQPAAIRAALEADGFVVAGIR